MIKKTLYKAFAVLALTVLTFTSFTATASAAQITARKVTLGSSAASASTTYAFNFTVPSATVLASAEFVACTTPSGACTTPSGFSVSSSTLTGQPTNLGDASGWTVSTATAGSLRLSKSGNVAAPTGSQTVSFSNVVNPSAANSTFFFRITTYTGSNWTGAVDTGTLAASTAGQITVNAVVDETVTFTLAAATVNLGTLTTSSTGTGTSTLVASTNATSGYSVTVSGNTLQNGAKSITSLSSQTASTQNATGGQFGINLVANTVPSVGSNVSGSGSAAAAGTYATANQFKFVSGDVIASAAAPTNSNTLTVSYIANIDGATAAGPYTTVLTYVATANF